MDDDFHRRASAYHEAGHSVVAYSVGWWVSIKGVEIDRRQYTGLRKYSFHNDARRNAMVGCAGWLAEHRWHGRASKFRPDEDLEFSLDEARYEAEAINDGDDEGTFREMLKEFPDKSDDELISMFREFEHWTWETISEDSVWQSVVRVAEALITKGSLTAAEVETLLAPELAPYGAG